MYFMYVLYSRTFRRFYKGYCSDPEKRLKEHNSGGTKSTKPFRPWELIYSEVFNSLNEALKREKYFKTAAGRL